MLVNICTCVILLITIFLTPSTYAFYGATEASVNKVVSILDDKGVKLKLEIELLESNLEKVEQRIDARVKFYKWVIGAFWGLYLLSVNFQLRFFGTANKLDEVFLRSIFEDFLLVTLFTLLALIAMISYKRASNMLIANIQFACVEQKTRKPIT